MYAECVDAAPGGGVRGVVEECEKSLGAKLPLRYMEVYYLDAPGICACCRVQMAV